MKAAQVAAALGGRKSGSGYSCPCPAHDDQHNSLSCSDGKKGLVWHCHAGCTQEEVRDALQARGLIDGPKSDNTRPDFSITGLGAPSSIWIYRSATGDELAVVARYDTPQGKQIRPWRRDGARWVCGALPGPRPLYGLDRLDRERNLPVLIVEGEKCAGAATKLIGAQYVCTTWIGGAKATGRTDWTPLRGRKVVIWPDADPPGQAATGAICGALKRIAASLSVVDPGDRPAGWDIADAIEEGWTADDVLTFIDEHTPIPAGNAEQEQADNEARLQYVLAQDLDDAGDDVDELIERTLTRGAMSVVYGDSNSGKTFLVIDMGCAIARGTPWLGRNVECGLVVYLAAEAPASIRRRARVYQRHHQVKVPNLAIVQSPIDLFNGSDDTEAVIRLIRHLEQLTGCKCELVIGDTLARLSAGANENSGEDMSVVVRHVDRIRHECQTHFLLVHHCGKDAARGMRGWSGLRAAVDTEIEVTAADDTGAHVAEITKQRDLDGKGERIGFRLQVVELGLAKWGRLSTSCVVVSADAPARPAGKRQSEIAGAIVEFLTARGSGIRKRELVDHFEGRYTASAVYRELKKMASAGGLREVAGVVALVRNEQRAA